MKALLMAMLGFCAGVVSAQAPRFTMELDSATFAPVQGGSTLLPAGWGGFEGERIDLDFTFPFLDSAFASVRYEATGRLVFDPAHYYYADVFTIANLQDGTLTGHAASEVSYLFRDGIEGRELVIQVLNARLAANPLHHLSFQIVLTEHGSLLYHMGPQSSIDVSSDITLGPYIGAYHATGFSPAFFDFGQCWLALQPDSCLLFQGANAAFLTYECTEMLNESGRVILRPLVPAGGLYATELPWQGECPQTLSAVEHWINTHPNQTIRIYNIHGQVVAEVVEIHQLKALPTGFYIAQTPCPIKFVLGGSTPAGGL